MNITIIGGTSYDDMVMDVYLVKMGNDVLCMDEAWRRGVV